MPDNAINFPYQRARVRYCKGGQWAASRSVQGFFSARRGPERWAPGITPRGEVKPDLFWEFAPPPPKSTKMGQKTFPNIIAPFLKLINVLLNKKK